MRRDNFYLLHVHTEYTYYLRKRATEQIGNRTDADTLQANVGKIKRMLVFILSISWIISIALNIQNSKQFTNRPMKCGLLVSRKRLNNYLYLNNCTWAIWNVSKSSPNHRNRAKGFQENYERTALQTNSGKETSVFEQSQRWKKRCRVKNGNIAIEQATLLP